MTWTAYVDESEPDPRSGSAGVYLLAAALIEDDRRDDARRCMAGLLLPGQPKLHWHIEDDRRRKSVTAAVAGLAVMHFVVTRVDPHARAERRRRLCLARLLVELDRAGVGDVYLESRQRKQNQLDMDMLNVLRARQEVGNGLRMFHRVGGSDPLLWIPDVVAGAVGARHRGNRMYEDALFGLVTYFEA